MNVKESTSFTANQNDGTVKENIIPEQRGFERDDQRKITGQVESLGLDGPGSIRTWKLRDDLVSKSNEGRDNTGRYTEGVQTAEKLTGIFGKKVI